MIHNLKSALKDLELILLGGPKNSSRVTEYLANIVTRPISFLWYSFWWLSKPLILWLTLASVIIFALSFVVDHSFAYELAPGSNVFLTSSTLMYVTYFVMALVSFLALPSSYGHHNVTDDELQAAQKIFRDREVFDNVEFAEKFIDTAERTAKTRVKIWIGISGFLWTLYLFELRVLIGIGDVTPSRSIDTMFFGSMIILLLASAYQKGVSKLFTLAQLTLSSHQTQANDAIC